jgi:hypothetical protein
VTPSAALRAKLDAALSEVTSAESALASLLANLRAAPRAEKVAADAPVEEAFTRLRAARAALAELREQLDDD